MTKSINDKQDLSPYLEMIDRLRNESFNVTTDQTLATHPYLIAAKEGKLSLAQRRAFVGEQFSIQYSDARSFAMLSGHLHFQPKSLASATVPSPVNEKDNDSGSPDLFQFLLGGEIYASKLLLDHASSIGLNPEDLQCYPVTAKGQAYPSYWARLALARQRAAGAAACAVNFPAWGRMCAELSKALQERPEYGYNDMSEEDRSTSLAFINFFGTPIEGLDEMAAKVMMEEDISYEDIVTEVRLLQAYEIMFWDACYNTNNNI